MVVLDINNVIALMVGCESFTISARIYVLSFSLISAEIKLLVKSERLRT